jgi:cation diffusion facilitator family transporter
MASESRTTVLIALGANVAVTGMKIVAGLIGGSSAMLSEGAHSLSDTVNELFLVASVHRSERPADSRHPFGYGAERFFWSLIAAVGIFVAGGLFSLFEAYRAFTDPPGAGSWVLEYVVLALSAVFESVSLVRALGQVRSCGRGRGVGGRRPLDHVRMSADPAVKTVASEDSIAVFGLVVAAAGVAAHQVTGNGAWEGAASTVIGVLLIVAAFALARDNMRLLVGQSLEPSMAESVGDTIAGHPMVEHVVEILTRYLGAHEVLVAARVELIDGLTSDQIESMSSGIDADLRGLNAEITQVFIDATTGAERRRSEARQSGPV